MYGKTYLSFEEALTLLADEGAPLSSQTLYALSGPSSAEVKLFREWWPAVPTERRKLVIAALTESAEANFELDFNALFRVTLEDDDDEVRTLSIEGLWEDEAVKLVMPLVNILRRDPALSARAAAAASLGRFVLLSEMEELDERYSKLVRGALLETVYSEEEEPDVRRRAVESIAFLTDECVRDIISAAYAEPYEEMRISAVFAMGRSNDPHWAPTVLRELASSSPEMRYEAARACGELEVKESVSELMRLVTDPDREVQFASIGALGQIGGPRARHILQILSRSEDDVVRLLAEDSLAELELGERPLDLLVCEPDEMEEDQEEDQEEDELGLWD
jgi:HEAT repeat protein